MPQVYDVCSGAQYTYMWTYPSTGKVGVHTNTPFYTQFRFSGIIIHLIPHPAVCLVGFAFFLFTSPIPTRIPLFIIYGTFFLNKTNQNVLSRGWRKYCKL